ncbi:membrane protein insertion efficiency factor YidD [Roseimarinus sediminis]|uniref:membrane protein insertion efficiency factor YidD n=1 Tax=Roseimarinus sediminis TaxID=1610899 RepID=UPI003D1E67F1
MRSHLLQISLATTLFISGFLGMKGLQAQTINIKSDLEQIQKKLHKQKTVHSTRPYIYKNETPSFKTLNPISLGYGGLLFVYQNTISQHFSADCLYHPSCSDFSKQAVHEFGLIKGGLLTFDRLNRCNRLSSVDLLPSDFDRHTHRAHDPISKYQ